MIHAADELRRRAERSNAAPPSPIVLDGPLLAFERPGPGLDIARELETARAYAEFVYATRGHRFVFASHYRGAAVPGFDGFVIDAGDRAVTNVSLKFDRTPRARPTPARLLQSLDRRRERPPRATCGLIAWCAAVNGWSRVGGGFAVDDPARDLARAVALWRGFGLDLPEPRPLTVVVDLRESGWSHEFARAASLRIDFALTLLWDKRRVLEFSPEA